MRLFVAGVLALVLAACSPLGVNRPDTGAGHLVIAKFPERVELGRYPLGINKTFFLSFIHSVSKTKVKDVYEIRGRRIVQTEEFFKAHGAGLPSSPEEPGGLSWEKTRDWFVLHMERPIPKLVVRTDKIYENRLGLGSEILDLNAWEDQALLIFVDSGEID